MLQLSYTFTSRLFLKSNKYWPSNSLWEFHIKSLMILYSFSLDSEALEASYSKKKSDAFKKIIPCLEDILALSTATLFPTLPGIKRKKNFMNFVFKTFNVENAFLCFYAICFTNIITTANYNHRLIKISILLIITK